MNIQEALKLSDKIRRESWAYSNLYIIQQPESGNREHCLEDIDAYFLYHYHQGDPDKRIEPTPLRFTKDDLLATDWEVYEEPKKDDFTFQLTMIDGERWVRFSDMAEAVKRESVSDVVRMRKNYNEIIEKLESQVEEQLQFVEVWKRRCNTSEAKVATLELACHQLEIVLEQAKKTTNATWRCCKDELPKENG